jgi:hypothetical protein
LVMAIERKCGEGRGGGEPLVRPPHIERRAATGRQATINVVGVLHDGE